MAKTSKQLLCKKTLTLNAGETKIADRVTLSSFKCADYFICADKGSSFAGYIIKLLASHDDNMVTDQVYAKHGGPVSILINTQIVGSNMELVIVNNEAVSVKVKLIRQTL